MFGLTLNTTDTKLITFDATLGILLPAATTVKQFSTYVLNCVLNQDAALVDRVGTQHISPAVAPAPLAR